jgi:hypothetical protein
MMKKWTINVFILLAFSLLNATIIHIPADYPAIQEGINASVDGDTVLVADGVYNENLSIDREITLASHFIIDGNISHRDSTIIDGGNYDEDSGPFGSCVLFRPPENGDAISPKLTGFTIQNGRGTRVRETIEGPEGPEVITYYMGGGLMIWYSLPEITYNYIRENGSELDTRAGSTKRGGAAGLNTDDDVEFDEDRNEPAPMTALTRDDEIIFSNNIFENNDSETGNTFESIGYVGDIDFSDSFFDVFASDNDDVSEYWIDTDEATTDFSGGSGEVEAITQDVFVSPEGSNENDGLSANTPYKHIDYALSQIYSDSLNVASIHLSDGFYSPSNTGESFPIVMISNVNLVGTGEGVTIIDAEQLSRVITMEGCENIGLNDLTIEGGNAEYQEDNNEGNTSFGGGIFLYYSRCLFNNIIISNNHAGNYGWGSGLYIYKSELAILNSIITENSGPWKGGGIAAIESELNLENVIVSENESNWGGGIYLQSSIPTFNLVEISGNNGGAGGGMYIYEYCFPDFQNLVVENNAAEVGGGIYLNGVYNNTNDLTFQNLIISDNSATTINPNVGYGGGVYIHETNVIFKNCGFYDNFAVKGGGLYSNNSYPKLQDVLINGNSATKWGGGLFLGGFSAYLDKVVLTNNISTGFYNNNGNYTEGYGGGIYLLNCFASLTNCTIYQNSADYGLGITLDAGSVSILVNSILWDINGEEEIYTHDYSYYTPNSVTVTHTNIRGGIDGITIADESEIIWLDGNIDADPLFVDPENVDFTLQEGSPCIDSGTPYFEIDGEIILDLEPSEYSGSAPDMGAFEFEGDTPSTMSVEYMEGWNIVGLPLYVEDASYGTLFTDAVNGTLYGYEGSYYGSDVLEAGNGYWLVFTNDGSAEISGEEITNLTISLSEGWNLIAGISSPVAVESISDPGSIIVSGTIYGYGGSYYNAEAIEPGKGYWVNAFADGEITLSSTAFVTKTLAQVNHFEGSNELDFNNGKYSAILYFGKEVVVEHRNSYSLPPTFPHMTFDVRFNGDMKYTVESGDIEVLNTSDNLTISYDIVIDAGEHMNWVLTSESGKDYVLEGTGEITVPTEETFTLERKAIIPITYTLHQNYPNPFNPITSLRYDLSEQAQVTLTVYDLIGREVTQLVNTVQDAGFKSVQWNATDMYGKSVSAGVYLYQIRAGKFVQTKKMVLLK